MASGEEIVRPSAPGPAPVPDTPILTPATLASLSLNEKESEEDVSTKIDDEEPEQEFLLIGIDFGTT